MKNEFIYQIFPQTFCEEGDKGVGNIKGIISKLDYLKELGITRIWVSPLTKSPFKDSGYDVSDYYSINEDFGTMDDFEKLISESKKRDLKIIIDIVFNHTSDQHEWFQKALDGDEKYMNYYIFKDPVNDKEPTNWKSKMGGSSWEFVPKINKYYLHLFTKEQPDLNWENIDLQKELIKILYFWKDKGVSGFRMDVCNLYSKPKEFKDDLYGDGRSYYTDGENVEKYFKLMNKEVFSKMDDVFTVGEVSSTTKEKSSQYAKQENNELDSVFTFLHLKVDYKDNNKWTYMKPDLNYFWELIKEWQIFFQKENSLLALFMNNHDQPRAISRFGNEDDYWFESATSIFGFTSLMRGIPFLYQGEEIGMTNLKFNQISDFKDVEAKGNSIDLLKTMNEREVVKILSSKSRDNARSIMQWNDKTNSGFSGAEKIDLFLNKNYKKINVEDQLKNNNSVLSFYKKIIKLRKKEEALFKGEISFFQDQQYIYKRKFKSSEFIIMTNWSNVNKIIDIDLNWLDWEVVLNNYESFEFDELKPYQLIVIKRK